MKVRSWSWRWREIREVGGPGSGRWRGWVERTVAVAHGWAVKGLVWPRTVAKDGWDGEGRWDGKGFVWKAGLVKRMVAVAGSRGTGSVCELSKFKRTLENLAKEYCNYTFVVLKHCYSWKNTRTLPCMLFEVNLYKNNARNWVTLCLFYLGENRESIWKSEDIQSGNLNCGRLFYANVADTPERRVDPKFRNSGVRSAG